ncbi:50S ribosomal protein L28 [[Mycoplasma] mobile]|uniref:Large ribosomal subunit protein bL28 n=1 Tax=Mycoplasma mobile (strain ATCC 43663 / 163K / NCTC 11711) TaxID=267748 RepID=RL28_MYCM1|nr:50S ribosomal protein L28 [[Mycoplasma] mobile]Q6KHM9.2 RecName: Full=Large ribosomal subunit protein bL28; AltName: Full=50S ribosomal protein L28 [Mycoplasma mobile 163K]
MARRDDLTNKGPMSGNKRSHALNATKRKFNLNLQKILVTLENGSKVKIKVSAKTAKTLKKQGFVA